MPNLWCKQRGYFLQLIEAEKAYLTCKEDEACKQRVIDSAKYLSQMQDTRLTWAKFNCTVLRSCDELNAMNRQWVHSMGIHNVVAELRRHYPHASHQDLLAAARRYS